MDAIKNLWGRAWWGKVVIVLGALFICGAIFNAIPSATPETDEPETVAEVAEVAEDVKAEDTDEPEETAEPTPEPTESGPSFDDGMHVVGTDIQPGIYRIAQSSSGCYWSRLAGFGGDLDDLIANDNAEGAVTVEILATDAGFESKRCGTWKLDDGSPVTESTTSFGEGTFMVGVDIEPGQYRNSGDGSCYWARLANFRSELDSINANDNVEGQTIVDIAPSDVGITSKRCGTWEKVQ